ncbi:MAG: sigma-70 family RNA polymerase sigma factor [Bacteroidota bacterium]
MRSTTHLAKLEALLARLPFELDDVQSANATFQNWVAHGRHQDRVAVDIWTYCYVWRNLITKFSRSSDLDNADFDMLVARVFERIVDRRHTIRDNSRYASWVSVICRNFFVNHLRAHKKSSVTNPADFTCATDEPVAFDDDLMVLHQVLQSAIARLPRYLQSVVEMRLFQHKSYDEISTLTGKSVEVIRSYVNKAVKRLREDRLLRRLIKRDFREDIDR